MHASILGATQKLSSFFFFRSVPYILDTSQNSLRYSFISSIYVVRENGATGHIEFASAIGALGGNKFEGAIGKALYSIRTLLSVDWSHGH